MHRTQLNGKGYTTPTGAGLEAAVASEGQHIFAFGELLQNIRKRIWVILLVTLVCVGATVAFSLLQTPRYEASIKLLVGQEQTSNPSTNLGSDVQGLQQLTQTMAEAVNTYPIAQNTIEQLSLQESPEDFLEKYLSVEQVKSTQLIQVNYEDPSPERAQLVANTIGDVFAEQVAETSASTNAVTVSVWERAPLPNKPVSPDLLLNIGVALIVGSILGVGLALLLEYLDDSWRSLEEVEQVSGLTVFGSIPDLSASTSTKKGKY